MRRRLSIRRLALPVVTAAALALSGCAQKADEAGAPASAEEMGAVKTGPGKTGPGKTKRVRVAVYNTSLYREEAGALIRELEAGTSPQLRAVEAVIERISPDILVLNEFDYDAAGAAIALFAERLGYPHALALPSNTGVPSGRDLDKDGRADHPEGSREYGNDAFGYGTHEGQYGIAVLSRLPIAQEEVRSWRRLLWRDFPGAALPEGHYDEGDLQVFRLSSKTHAVVPIETPSGPLHLVLAHPTPPGFDGPENRNGLRNADEIRLLHAIIDPARGAGITDDAGMAGGLGEGAMFVIAGDLNADPSAGERAGEGEGGAIAALLASPLLTDPKPRSSGAAAAALRQGGANSEQKDDPSLDTADFSDNGIGNLRVDYLLPSSHFTVEDTGVFWPAEGEPGYALIGPGWPVVSSDHRLVYADLVLPESEEKPRAEQVR